MQKPIIVLINYKGLPNNCLGHEINLGRCILIDFLLQNKIDLETIVVTIPDRMFLYTAIFKNTISDVDYFNITKKEDYDVYDLTEYTSSSGNIYQYCRDLFSRINYTIPAKYYTPEFQSYITRITYLPLEFNNDFILIHHRYGANVNKLKNMVVSLYKKFPNHTIVLFNNDIANLKSHFLDKPNIIYTDHLQTYASYMNHKKCTFLITEFSGGGQLANYCCNSNIYVHFETYPFSFNGYKNRNFDYVKDLPELLNYALSDTYIDCQDFKKFTNGKLKSFYNIDSLLEIINIPTVTFTSDWFDTLAKDNFENVILPLFKDKPVNYLEIGSFEGASMHYLFENVFTNQNTRAVVIDPFESSQTHNIPIERFKKNLYKHLHKIHIITGFSGIELPKLTQMFDLIYIDGDHSSTAVLEDALFSFRLLNPGGYMVFDDYLWGTQDRGVNSIEIPYKGINIFLKYVESEIEIIKSNWQIIVRKK